MDHSNKIQQALYRLRHLFQADFKFRHIRSYVEEYIFSREECDQIMDVQDLNDQTDYLFFLLIYKNKNIENFIEKLAIMYDWLADGINQFLSTDFWDNLCSMYSKQIHTLSNDVPKHFELNVHRLEYVSVFKVHKIL